MTRHEVCERLGVASCARLTVCEPTVGQAGCLAESMAQCCPDGVCDEPVIADEERVVACETAVATMSCSDLADRDLPESCNHLLDDLPQQQQPPPPGQGVLEVNWEILAGGNAVSCDQFSKTANVRVVATPPDGAAIAREFACVAGGALTTLPTGPYSVLAQARTASGVVVEQTLARTVVIEDTASTSFTFAVTTSVGQFCAQFTDAVCGACAPTDSSCPNLIFGDCCDDDGACERPGLVDPGTFQACLSAIATGSFCSALPPACDHVIVNF